MITNDGKYTKPRVAVLKFEGTYHYIEQKVEPLKHTTAPSQEGTMGCNYNPLKTRNDKNYLKKHIFNFSLIHV